MPFSSSQTVSLPEALKVYTNPPFPPRHFGQPRSHDVGIGHRRPALQGGGQWQWHPGGESLVPEFDAV